MSLLPEISQASAEINKLVAQANIHQTIAPVDPAEFTSPADTLLLASRDPVIREVSVGMTGVEAVQNTVSGTPPLSLPNSLGKPLKAWEVDVVPKQDLNGYDSPWPAGGGVNLLPFEDVFENGWTTTIDDLTATYNNGYMKVTGTNTTSGFINIVPYRDAWLNNRIVLGAGSYSIPDYVTLTASIDGGKDENLNNTITAVTSLSVRGFYIAVRGGETVDYNIPMMFVRGTTRPTSYSPYSNLCPIHGTDKLNLFVEESYDQSATPKAVLTLPQTVYTGTIGSEGGESRSAYVLLNDPDKWRVATGNTITFQYMQEFRDRAQYPNDSYSGLNCSYVPIIRYSRFTGRWNGATQFYFGIYDPDGTLTLDQIKADAAAGKIAICYELATPTTCAVPSVSIPTPTGTATTWATAEDGTVDTMEVTYIGKA